MTALLSGACFFFNLPSSLLTSARHAYHLNRLDSRKESRHTRI